MPRVASNYAFAIKMTFAMALASIIYFRVGLDLISYAKNDFSGPFTGVAEFLEIVVPVSIGIILVGTWLWVIYGPVQRERARVRGGPPR